MVKEVARSKAYSVNWETLNVLPVFATAEEKLERVFRSPLSVSANCRGTQSPLHWGSIFSTLVMPGAKMDGASIYELLDTYKVSFTAAVPTIWLMLLQDLENTGGKLPHLKRVVIGGSACPRAMTSRASDSEYACTAASYCPSE